MKKIQIVEYFTPRLFECLPEYSITPIDDNSYRVEWDKYYLGDINLERWMIITYLRDSRNLFIEFQYNSFKFEGVTFEKFFDLYFKDVQEFVVPLNKRLHVDLEETLDFWEKEVFNYYIEEKITGDELADVMNFFRSKCMISAASIVIENIMMESPLLMSLFKRPLETFPLIYGYPFCTKFFLKYIMPLLYDIVKNKKILI